MHDISSASSPRSLRRCELPWLYILLIALIAAMLLTASPVRAATFQVTTLADTGAAAGELRWAIQQANASPGPDAIEFALAGTVSIDPVLGSLPALTDNGTVIDGSTAPDALAGPDIVIDGGGVAGTRGLTLQADSCVVLGLTLQRCEIGVELSPNPDSTTTRFNEVGRSGARELVVTRDNLFYGIVVTGQGTTRNHITHCFVGTDYTGTVAAPNGLDGIAILGQAAFNLVGSFADPAPTNVVSGNAGDGIFLANCDENVIVNTYVGTDIHGTTALPNAANGIDLQGAVRRNRIARCLVSGNGGDGVHLNQGARSNVVETCHIGTEVSGTGPLANGGRGIHVGYAQRNRLGPANVVSGNTLEGMLFEGVGCDSNRVVQSIIGADVSGASPLPNGMSGILVIDGPTYNLVTRSLVSANARSGVVIRGLGTTYNEVLSCRIGSDLSGYARLANAGHGVVVADEACYNWIGRAGGLGNLIVGHDTAGMCGVLITDPETSYNHVAGCIIGLDRDADAELPNHQGVRTQNNAVHNFIGPENVISGNDDAGAQIDTGTQEIFHNLIGLAGDGLAARPNKIGIWITSSSNIVANNYVSANESTGILVGTGCTPGYNEFTANVIGLDLAGADAGNGGDGMWFLDDAPYNLIGLSASTGNTIWYNTGNGIRVGDASAAAYGPFENRILYNSISQNGLLGIENEDGGNQETPPPTLDAVTATQIEYTVSAAGLVQFFCSDDDEGARYLGEDAPGAAGSHTVSIAVPTGCYVTATLTPASADDTSEFSGAVWLESEADTFAAGEGAEPATGDAEEADDATWVGAYGPNPVRLSAAGAAGALQLHLAEPARVTLELYDATGRLVRGTSGGTTVLDLPAGTHHLCWDGADGQGARLTTGCYYLRVGLPDQVHVRRFLAVR